MMRPVVLWSASFLYQSEWRVTVTEIAGLVVIARLKVSSESREASRTRMEL